MSDITIFKNEELNVELRTILLDGVEWFIAKDVADYLEYSDTQAMTKRLDEDDVRSVPEKFSGINYNVYPHYELVKFFIKQGHDLNLY